MRKPGSLLLLSLLAVAPPVRAQVSGLLPPRGRDSLLAADARDSTAKRERQRHLDSLAAGRRRWTAQQPAEYQLQVHNDCFCLVTGPDPVPLVNVRNGVIVSRVPGRPVTATIEQFTVEALFNAIQRDIQDDGRRVNKLALHPTYGFPVEYSAFTVGVSDLETHYVVDSFAVVSGARAPQPGGGSALAASIRAGLVAPPQSFATSWVADMDRYVEAAHLKPLRVQAVPSGTREIRIWIGGGLGWPQELFRLVERNNHVTGEYFRYWDLKSDGDSTNGRTFASLMRYHEQGRCVLLPKGKEAEACRALFRSAPDWKAVWQAGEKVDVWRLPDASTLTGGHVVEDGWGITTELRDDQGYRAWHYSNPDAQPWPEATRAVAFADALRQVSNLLRRSAAEKRYVGRLSVRPDTLEFFPCAGGGPWFLETFDSLLVGRRGVGGLPAGSEHRLVVRGTLAPDWVVRRWWDFPPRFSRALEVDSVLTVAPWRPGACK